MALFAAVTPLRLPTTFSPDVAATPCCLLAPYYALLPFFFAFVAADDATLLAAAAALYGELAPRCLMLLMVRYVAFFSFSSF